MEPLERFHVRASGKRRAGPWSVPFDGRSRFYHCPGCGARTLVRWRALDIFNPPLSPFSAELRERFGEVGESRAALDFYCRGCDAPVRLVFWGQERGMGGWWYGFVIAVLEVER